MHQSRLSNFTLLIFDNVVNKMPLPVNDKLGERVSLLLNYYLPAFVPSAQLLVSQLKKYFFFQIV